MLVNRFRILKAASDICSADWQLRFGRLITAGLVLHNICLHQKELVALRATFALDDEDRHAADFVTASNWYVHDPAVRGIDVTSPTTFFTLSATVLRCCACTGGAR
jgi:hypothetical protein